MVVAAAAAVVAITVNLAALLANSAISIESLISADRSVRLSAVYAGTLESSFHFRFHYPKTLNPKSPKPYCGLLQLEV